MKFLQVTVVHVIGDKHHEPGPYHVRLDEVVGFGSVQARARPGRPNARLDLRGAVDGAPLRSLLVKEHVTTLERAINAHVEVPTS